MSTRPQTNATIEQLCAAQAAAAVSGQQLALAQQQLAAAGAEADALRTQVASGWAAAEQAQREAEASRRELAMARVDVQSKADMAQVWREAWPPSSSSMYDGIICSQHTVPPPMGVLVSQRAD